ncbi:MAG: hypothetical protein ABR905_04525 [Terracidiphilus sp.]|jgi:hypothetical protein
MKKWDKKYRMVFLAFLLVLDLLGMLWADMMHWNHSALTHECGTMIMFAIMVLWVDYRKAIGLALCVADLIAFVVRSRVGGTSLSWLIPMGLLLLYFVWCLVAVALKARKSRLRLEIFGEARH